MTIQTDRIQQLIHEYTRHLKVREQLQKKSNLETLTKGKVTLSIEAKKLNIRKMMASIVYRKITEQDPREMVASIIYRKITEQEANG